MQIKATDNPIMGRIWAILTALLVSYAGYDQYEKSQAAVETTVNVNVEGIDPAPEQVHSHAAVVSRDQINAIVAAAIAANNKELNITYKKLESWEKN